MKITKKNITVRILVSILINCMVLSACNDIPFIRTDYHQNNSTTDVVFKVQVPEGTRIENGLFLEILDEVTGLIMNPTRYQLQPQTNNIYSISIPLVIGSVVKYRYVRGGTPAMIEFTAQKSQVRYRLYQVTNSNEVEDLVSGWQDLPYQGDTGTIQGYIYDSLSNIPIANVMVIVSGMRTFTMEDGSYTISGIPSGKNRLDAYHVDGIYQPFQQDAIIANNSTTPANFVMLARKMVNVTFNVIPPKENIVGAPIRLIGNLYNLGNSFLDLGGGVNVKAINAPLLTFQSDGSYSITLNLPAGHFLEYKYSLGDGFWNAEHNFDFSWRLRQIFIPDNDTVINDSISTWKNSNDSPVTFNVNTPQNTPSSSTLFIQLNPFAWMEPLPMWDLGNNQWTYTLYGPSEMITNSQYRFILNTQQNFVYDSATPKQNSSGIKIDSSQSVINHSIQSWSTP